MSILLFVCGKPHYAHLPLISCDRWQIVNSYWEGCF